MSWLEKRALKLADYLEYDSSKEAIAEAMLVLAKEFAERALIASESMRGEAVSVVIAAAESEDED